MHLCVRVCVWFYAIVSHVQMTHPQFDSCFKAKRWALVLVRREVEEEIQWPLCPDIPTNSKMDPLLRAKQSSDRGT